MPMENEQNQNDLSIKEQREVKHEQKIKHRSEAEKIARKETLYRVVLWVFVAIVFCAAIFAMIKLANTSPTASSTTVDILPTVTSEDWMKDNVNAKTTLIEYGDFQCPACGAFYPLTQEVHKDFGSNLRFIFREFPLSMHADATAAAAAAEAAGNQGKFWEMYDLLYTNQKVWGSNLEVHNPNLSAIFLSYAKQLGLNTDQFQKDVVSPETAKKIQDDYASGLSFGVDATPTFFLNNEKLSPTSAQDFLSSIQNAIQAANGSTTNGTATTTK